MAELADAHVCLIPLYSYFQISMKQLGFSTVMANLLSVPNTVWSIFNLVLLTAMTEVFQNRWFVCSLENWWWLAPFIALVAMPSISPWTYFALATVILSFPVSPTSHVQTPRHSADHRFLSAVRARGPGRLVLAKRRLCTDADRLGITLQHVCAGISDHRSEQYVVWKSLAFSGECRS